MPFSPEQRTDFLQALKNVFSEQLKDFAFATDLRAAGALDSLGILMLISFLDEKYARTFSAETLSLVRSPEDILALLEK